MAELTEKQKRMKEIVEKFQEYVATYSEQQGYLDYKDETFMDDMVYGIGIAFDKNKFSFSEGFSKFKKKLMKRWIGDGDC